MQQQIKFKLPRLLLVGILFLTANLASAQEPTGTSAADFAGELLRKYPYLLSNQQRTACDEINRQLREAQQQSKQAIDGVRKEQAERALAVAATNLATLLESCDTIVHVSLENAKAIARPAGAYELPGDMGALLIRAQSGEGPAGFITYELDQSKRDGKNDIECLPAGTTWALVGLRNVPAQRTSLPFEFDRADLPSQQMLLDVTTPDNGQLKVSILSHDTHEPTPAMVRLVWKTSGADRRPSTAVDLAPLFDEQGHAHGRRRPNLPGPLGDWFWCVAKPFSMALPPGQYDITISRGVEHLPLMDSFRVESGQLVEKTYEPKRWVDMRQLGWYSGDDHVHGQILSDEDAQRLMAWVQAEDIHVANIVKMGDIYRTWFEQRGFGPEHRVIDGDYVLSPGQECPRTHDEIGHTLAMNTTSMVRDTDKYFLYDWIADNVHSQGGLWGYAHINSGIFHVHRDMSINIPKGNCDFAEILQFQQLGTDLYYDFLNTGFKVTASAGSDVPWGGSVGEVRVYAHVPQQPFSPDAWFEAVKRGRTFVTSGPMIELQVDDALPGDEIVVDDRRKLRIRARAWGHPQRMVPTKLEIIRHGEVIRTVESTDLNRAELSVDFQQETDNGCWIAARATANDGTTAHTTPVYVIRKGLRFWKYDSVDQLIAKRNASLDEIEQLVADAEAKLAARDAAGDRWDRQLAAQGPELLKRVVEARKLYQELEKIAEAERATRSATK
ncbi:MAG: CehA/McbA family metallohydrolase [Bythopirellula sp.]